MQKCARTVGLVLTSALLASPSRAGDLAPPAGTVDSTMKSLAEVEPRTPVGPDTTPGDGAATYVISASGSYYLVEDLSGETGKDGIRIEAENVDLDLNGFTLVGVTGSGDGVDVNVGGARENIHVHSGAARNWDGTGIDMRDAVYSSVRGLTVYNCESYGIRIGDYSNVQNCRVAACVLTGILAANNAVIDRCVTRVCMDDGINADDGSIVAWCTSIANEIDGISVGTGGAIYQSTAQSNQRHGFNGAAAQIMDCFAENNQTGVNVSCCSLITGVNCASNPAGISASGGRNRIDSNNVTGSSTAFDISGTDNLIVRNSASNNTTDYSIASGNAYGPLVSVAGVDDMTGTVGSNHPWANFAY